MTITPYIRNVLLSLPLVIATVVPFIYLANSIGLTLNGKIIALGALGWWLALLLRIPVMLLTRHLPQDKAQSRIVSASGPAEESVRLIFLLLLGLTVDNAFSLGLGWAAIEIVYAIIQSFGWGVLEQHTDKQAEDAKALLKRQGMDKSFTPAAPFWGILERLSANALHISFSLLLVVSPWLVILTAPFHSFANFAITKLVKKSMAIAEITLAVVAGVLLAVAITLVA